MSARSLEQLRDAALVAARAGGEVVLEHFGRARDVREKAPGDWVSAADVASEQAARETLEELAPGVAFFGEETGGTRANRGWYVDPLDGTANFLHGFVAVGVSIGLVDDGVPVVGVVHAPMLGHTYHAFAGGGAFVDDQRIRVSERAPAQAIPATGFPFRRKHELDRYLDVFHRTFEVVEDLRRVGAASLDLAWTAEGVLDGFFEVGLGTWDVAAGALLVREAGGVVTDWAGDPEAWLWSGDIVAGPPAVHEQLVAITRTAGSTQ
ncbi:MAG TPA: inositol monophosphatase family protein [Acidimicrobiia bacterium]